MRKPKHIVSLFLIIVIGILMVLAVRGDFGDTAQHPSARGMDYCEACEDDPPPPDCPCGDCVNGCGGGCTDNDNDGICDEYDNCVGYEGMEWEEVCDRYCEDENPYTGECDDWSGWDCEIVGNHETCTPY